MVDFAVARRAMVDCQVRPSDVTNLRLIGAMMDVPRERFVPAAQRAVAYLDRDIAVTGGRMLIKPMVLAKLLQAAEIAEGERVLDVGCASGYSTAVIGKLAGEVVALEEDTALARGAGETLAATGASNISVVSGPLATGWPGGAPYDVIVVEGAVETVPDSLLKQLNEGGRLLTVVNSSGLMGKATVYRMGGGHVTAQPLFDASAPLLQAFAKPPAFVF